MKAFRQLLTFLLFLITAGLSEGAIAQKPKPAKEVAIKAAIDSMRFTFYAHYMTPMGGRQRYLTTEYKVSVSKDTVECDLPYFGKAYSAPINPTDGGIKFTSTNFDYKTTPRKKGRWDIYIKIKDISPRQELTLTVFDNGSASLYVNSTNRQPISFSGDVSGSKVR